MKKVVVTGGSGRLGQRIISDLLSRGFQVLSLDKIAPARMLCDSWIADLRRPEDIYQALDGAYGVVHLGAHQAPNLVPDSETFGNNVTATYNVLKAAADLQVRKAVVASSTAAFGFIYARRPRVPDYLPLDENHPSRPQDSYGLSKVVGEQIADAMVAAQPEMTVSSLRFPGINFDLTYKSFRERWNNPGAKLGSLWSYIDARDAAGACRSALEATFAGHEVFIVAAPTGTTDRPTDELVKKYLPSVMITGEQRSGNWSGVSSAKAAKVLGFTAAYRWEIYRDA